MLTSQAVIDVENYWAAHFGRSSGRLFAKPWQIVAHTGELADYPGIFSLFRNGAAIASVPSERTDLHRILSSIVEPPTPTVVRERLVSVATKIIGPAEIRYTTIIPELPCRARELTTDDEPAIARLEQSCDRTEWEHGGSNGELPGSGVFVDGDLAALASYEIWGERLAHLSIITHPAHRGRGFGREAVAHLVQRALKAGLLPQYRTLAANHASVRIAAALGFELYATSLAVRL